MSPCKARISKKTAGFQPVKVYRINGIILSMAEQEQRFRQVIEETHLAIQGQKSKAGLGYFFPSKEAGRIRTYARFIRATEAEFSLNDIEIGALSEAFGERLEGLWRIDRAGKIPLSFSFLRTRQVNKAVNYVFSLGQGSEQRFLVASLSLMLDRGGNSDAYLELLRSARRLGLDLGPYFWNPLTSSETIISVLEGGVKEIRTLRI